jgi:hypothetical protein
MDNLIHGGSSLELMHSSINKAKQKFLQKQISYFQPNCYEINDDNQ